MKDKTWYWILGIIAAYFVVKFIMNQTAKKPNYGDNENLYLSDGKLHDRYGHTEGEEGPTCTYCGSKTYYDKMHHPLGRGFILKPVCSNPDCDSQTLCY